MIGVDPLRDPTPCLVATVGFAVRTATVQSRGEAAGRGDLPAMLDEALRRCAASASTRAPQRAR